MLELRLLWVCLLVQSRWFLPTSSNNFASWNISSQSWWVWWYSLHMYYTCTPSQIALATHHIGNYSWSVDQAQHIQAAHRRCSRSAVINTKNRGIQSTLEDTGGHSTQNQYLHLSTPLWLCLSQGLSSSSHMCTAPGWGKAGYGVHWDPLSSFIGISIGSTRGTTSPKHLFIVVATWFYIPLCWLKNIENGLSLFWDSRIANRMLPPTVLTMAWMRDSSLSHFRIVNTIGHLEQTRPGAANKKAGFEPKKEIEILKSIEQLWKPQHQTTLPILTSSTNGEQNKFRLLQWTMILCNTH